MAIAGAATTPSTTTPPAASTPSTGAPSGSMHGYCPNMGGSTGTTSGSSSSNV
jgi:hypothetical protein